MNRDRLASALIALLALVALGVGAATIDAPTQSGDGPGSAGGSGGFLGEGSTFDLGRPAPIEPADGPAIPDIVFQLLVIAFVALVGLYVLHEGLRLRDLAVVFGLLVFAGLLLALYEHLGAVDIGAGNGSGALGSGTPAFPGGGDDDAAPTVTTDPPLLALAVAAVLLVGTIFILLRPSATTDDDEEPTRADAVDMTAVGRAAGRAADRITEDATVENEVYRAWREMTDHLDVERPVSSTPGEFAHAATDAGMARGDVEELTDLFRTVRYGGSDATTARETRAVAALRRIEDEYTEEP